MVRTLNFIIIKTFFTSSHDLSFFWSIDVNHDMVKTRLSSTGLTVEAPTSGELKGDLERVANQRVEGYCASF